MSTSLPHLRTRHPWGTTTPGPARPIPPLVAVGAALRSLGAALVPGRAAEDVMPALNAADAQAMLATVGLLDPDDRSGRWDRPTTDAVAAFQRARHLPATGVADRRTADLLLDAVGGRRAGAGAGRGAIDGRQSSPASGSSGPARSANSTWA